MAKKKSNNEELRELIASHNLTRQYIADECAGGSIETVKSWLKGADNPSYRNMPDAKLELLKLKLQFRKVTSE